MKEYIINFIKEIEFEKKYSIHTIDGYTKDLNFFIEYLNEKNIKNYNDVDYNLIREYISYLYDLGHSNKTISRNISSIRSFFKYLYKEKLVNNNPTTLISNPKLDKRLPKYLNFEDTEKLLKAYDTDNYISIRNSLILEMLYSTGIRVSELVNIKMKDISILDTSIKIIGKGSKERIVYFGNKCLVLIKKYLNISRDKLNKNNYDYFLLSNTGKKMNDRLIRKIVDDAASIAHLNIKISPHVLRHTFATHMLIDGSDIRSVQELLGHENLSTTQVYTHLTNEKIRSVYLNTHPRARKR